MTVPEVYHFDENGIYQGSNPAHASPLEQDVFFLPANATWTAPPAITDGHQAVFANDAWTLQAIPAPDHAPLVTSSADQARASINATIAQLQALQPAAQEALNAANADLATAQASGNADDIAAKEGPQIFAAAQVAILEAQITSLQDALPPAASSGGG